MKNSATPTTRSTELGILSRGLIDAKNGLDRAKRAARLLRRPDLVEAIAEIIDDVDSAYRDAHHPFRTL